MYETQTDSVILQRMLDRVASKYDKREGSVIYDTHSPTSIELALLYIELDVLIENTYGDTAAREYLILRAAERGLTPYEASAATVLGYFTPTDIDVTGYRFSCEDLNYTVTEAATDYGAGYYYLVCETAGVVGNQYLGTLIPIDYVSGLETAELVSVVIPGEDEEDTEEFRTRYLESFDENAFGGNVTDYQEKVLAISGVGAVKVQRVSNGDIVVADMIPSDTVTSWYEDVIDSLSDEVATWLATVYTAAVNKYLTVGGTVKLTILDSNYDSASDELVELVQTTIDPEQNAGEGLGLAPIGHVVNVIAATETEIDVYTEVTFSSAYSWDTLESYVIEAIEEYLLSLRQEWSSHYTDYDSDPLIVRIAQIENYIMGVTGVIDVSGTTINGDEENLNLDYDAIPVMGELTHND